MGRGGRRYQDSEEEYVKVQPRRDSSQERSPSYQNQEQDYSTPQGREYTQDNERYSSRYRGRGSTRGYRGRGSRGSYRGGRGGRYNLDRDNQDSIKQEDSEEDNLPSYPSRPSQRRGKRGGLLDRINIKTNHTQQIKIPKQTTPKSQQLSLSQRLSVNKPSTDTTSKILSRNTTYKGTGNQHEQLLKKISSFKGNELLTRKYTIHVKKRRIRLAGVNGTLSKSIRKLEELELNRADCLGMCPFKEIQERTGDRLIDPLEKKQGSIDRTRMIKKYARSAADKKLDLSDLLRPPFILLQTAEFLIRNIVGDDLKEDSYLGVKEDGSRWKFEEIYSFATDRFRSINQDIQILKTFCPEILATKNVIKTYEKIVNFYLFSVNELLDYDDFDSQINLTQLSKIIEGLISCYSKVSELTPEFHSEKLESSQRGVDLSIEEIMKMAEDVIYVSPFEAKYLSVNIVLQYFESPTLYQTKLSQAVAKHPKINGSPVFKSMLKMINSIEMGHFEEFFNLLSKEESLELVSVFSFPEYLNGVRTKYMNVLKLFNNPTLRMWNPATEVTGLGEMDDEYADLMENVDTKPVANPSRILEWDLVISKLRLENDLNLKIFLSYYYGRKRKEHIEIFNESSREIYIHHFNPKPSVLKKVQHKLQLGSQSIPTNLAKKIGFSRNFLINGLSPKPLDLNYSTSVHRYYQKAMENVRSKKVKNSSKNEAYFKSSQAVQEIEELEREEEIMESRKKSINSSMLLNRLSSQDCSKILNSKQKIDPRNSGNLSQNNGILNITGSSNSLLFGLTPDKSKLIQPKAKDTSSSHLNPPKKISIKRNQKIVKTQSELKKISLKMIHFSNKYLTKIKRQSFRKWNLLKVAENQRHFELLEQSQEKRRIQILEAYFNNLLDHTINQQIKFQEGCLNPVVTQLSYNDKYLINKSRITPFRHPYEFYFESIFEVLIEEWGKLSQRLNKQHNLQTVSYFEMNWLFIADNKDSSIQPLQQFFELVRGGEGDYSSFFDINFWEDTEGSQFYKTLYYSKQEDIMNTDQSSVQEQSIQLCFEWRQSQSITKDSDLSNYDMIFYLNDQEIKENQCLETIRTLVNKSNHESKKDSTFSLLNSSTFNSFKDLLSLGQKPLVQIRIQKEDMEVDDQTQQNHTISFYHEEAETELLEYHPFNLIMNIETLQGFYEICRFGIENILEQVDRTLIKADVSYVKIIEDFEEWSIDEVFEYLKTVFQKFDESELEIDNKLNKVLPESRNYSILKFSQILVGEGLRSFYASKNFIIQIIDDLIKVNISLGGQDNPIIMNTLSKIKEIAQFKNLEKDLKQSSIPCFKSRSRVHIYEAISQILGQFLPNVSEEEILKGLKDRYDSYLKESSISWELCSFQDSKFRFIELYICFFTILEDSYQRLLINSKVEDRFYSPIIKIPLNFKDDLFNYFNYTQMFNNSILDAKRNRDRSFSLNNINQKLDYILDNRRLHYYTGMKYSKYPTAYKLMQNNSEESKFNNSEDEYNQRSKEYSRKSAISFERKTKLKYKKSKNLNYNESNSQDNSSSSSFNPPRGIVSNRDAELSKQFKLAVEGNVFNTNRHLEEFRQWEQQSENSSSSELDEHRDTHLNINRYKSKKKLLLMDEFEDDDDLYSGFEHSSLHYSFIDKYTNTEL